MMIKIMNAILLGATIMVMAIVVGCETTIITENPTSPEVDSPLIIGAPTRTPWGCILWRDSGIKEQQKCCPLAPVVPSEEEPNVGGWELKTWDC
jgi:hypothetical protein